MMKRLVGLGLGLALLGAGTAAWAGQRGIGILAIDLTSRYLHGSMGDARNSSDSNASLEVLVQGYPTFELGTIFARDASDQFAYCYTYSSSIISALKSVTDDSFIEARWDESNMCTFVEVRASSIRAPKVP